MLKIEVPLEAERWDEEKEEFIIPKTVTLTLEHSLLSISKWESKWHKPYISSAPDDDKTYEEIVDYIRCMTLSINPKVSDPDGIYSNITYDNIDAINEYVRDPMTATTFYDLTGSSNVGNRQKIVTKTSEQIYCDMVMLNIPVQFEKWHINRLLTLIRLCDMRYNPGEKMSEEDTMQMYSRLNAQRQAKLKNSR